MSKFKKDELWADIEGYEGVYQISTLGNARSLSRVIKRKGGYFTLRGKYLKAYKSDNCFYYTLSKNGASKHKKVHRLIAAAFILNPDKKPEINHIDNNPFNNNISNLEWCTHKENIKHRDKQGRGRVLQNQKHGTQHHFARPFYQLTKEGQVIKKWNYITEFIKSNQYGNITTIWSVLNKKRPSAYGYRFAYVSIPELTEIKIEQHQ